MTELQEKIEQGFSQLDSDEIFRATIRLALDRYEPIKIANELSVARSTVLRWADDGSSLPHPLMRKPVYYVLQRFEGQ